MFRKPRNKKKINKKNLKSDSRTNDSPSFHSVAKQQRTFVNIAVVLSATPHKYSAHQSCNISAVTEIRNKSKRTRANRTNRVGWKKIQ